MSAPEQPTPQFTAHDLMTAFLDNVPDYVYFKDRNSCFIAASKSKALRHGFTSQAELIGKHDRDFFDPAKTIVKEVEESTIMRTEQPMISHRQKVTLPDGSHGWSLVSKLPLHDEQGQVIGTFGISTDITNIVKTEQELEKSRKELFDFSRQAGRAEVATGVLHNIGNVLNSLNVSTTLIATALRQSKTESLTKITQLLQDHAADLADYLTHDPKGKLVPEFIASLARHSIEERTRLLGELESLQKNIDHIKEIVAMQQSYATMIGVIEPLPAATLMEDSLLMNSGALQRHDVQVVRDFQVVPPVLAEKGKVLQILINLIRNGKYACDESGRTDKVLTLRVAPGPAGFVHLIVQDNGIGIAPEGLGQIFQHGYTTRSYGHGFGLHSSRHVAEEMKGSLTVHSTGLQQGASFTLALPVAPLPAQPKC